jgi:hypothetical protein
MGDLNIINQAGNASNGLRYLDMSYSDGLSLADALTAAQGTYGNARLAIASEWDDLFAAAGIGYLTSALPASAGFGEGSNYIFTQDYDGGLLQAFLGDTVSSAPGLTAIWTTPDGLLSEFSTYDYTLLDQTYAGFYQASEVPGHYHVGWLLVSEVSAVPAPPALILFALGLAGLGLAKRRIGQAQA